MKHPEKVQLSILLREIKDGSLQNILRRVIFSKENVYEVLKEERPYLKIK